MQNFKKFNFFSEFNNVRSLIINNECLLKDNAYSYYSVQVVGSYFPVNLSQMHYLIAMLVQRKEH